MDYISQKDWRCNLMITYLFGGATKKSLLGSWTNKDPLLYKGIFLKK